MPKISPKSCRKTALDKKLRKTGGSSIDFHCLGPIWNVRSPVMTAVLPGDFFYAQKCNNFNAIFKLLVSLSFSKTLSKPEIDNMILFYGSGMYFLS